MRHAMHSLTPLAAAVGGLLAGAVGTVCLDAVQYLRHRRDGGTESPLAWEFAPVGSWAQAPDPGQVARRVLEGFTQRKLSDSWAFPLSTAMHWGYGTGAAVLYGILAGSLLRPRAAYGLPFGAALCGASYVVLPQA